MPLHNKEQVPLNVVNKLVGPSFFVELGESAIVDKHGESPAPVDEFTDSKQPTTPTLKQQTTPTPKQQSTMHATVRWKTV